MCDFHVLPRHSARLAASRQPSVSLVFVVAAIRFGVLLDAARIVVLRVVPRITFYRVCFCTVHIF